MPYSERRVIECLREGARRFKWERRQQQPGTVRDGKWLVGFGVAAAIRLAPDSTCIVLSDMTDIWTGTCTVLASEPFLINTDRAIGLALVVTELVANAAKHAYPDDRHGLVWVRLARCDGETRQISVSDEGVGLPADFEINKKIGFGMRIVRALARQTRAQLRIERLSSFWKFRLARTGQYVRTDLKREQRKSRQSMKRRKFITLLGSAVAYAERSDKD